MNLPTPSTHADLDTLAVKETSMTIALYTAISLKHGNIVTVYSTTRKVDTYGPRPRLEMLFQVFDHIPGHTGDHLDTFEALDDAQQYADLYVRFIDADSDGCSPEAAAMCAFSLEKSVYDVAIREEGM